MEREHRDANRSNWDDRVPVHLASSFYDVEGWLAAPRGPRQREAEILGDVRDLSLVHLQCHFGLDTLGWAIAGARVVGLDFSGPATDAARDLAARGGLADRARFVCADVYDAAAALAGETFDIVYVSLGALCWLPSVERWAEQAVALLRAGGRLFLHDGHPLAWALADDDLVIEHSYFEEVEPYFDDSDVTYTDGDGRVAHARSYEWNHGLGEIVNALVTRGLHIDRLDEHDWAPYARFSWLVDRGDHHYVMPPGRPRVPLSFTLLATKTA